LTYNQWISSGYDLLKQARISEAVLAATEAAKKDPSRFEAYTLAALALHTGGADREATPFIDKALSLAPPDRQRLLSDLANQIASGLSGAAKESPVNVEFRRKLDALRLIIDDADKAVTADGRRKFLQEFLDKSGPFLKDYPDQVNIWMLNGIAAAELDDAKLAWEAGQALKRLKADESDDPDMRRFMATLERKGWLGDQPPLSREDALEQRRATELFGHMEMRFALECHRPFHPAIIADILLCNQLFGRTIHA
jgi:hypothetical protein